MSEYRIDGLGFLRRDGKVIGWTPYDFFWALRGWFKSTRSASPKTEERQDD
jgi:hypothetical protein